MIELKISGATPKSGKSICLTCKCAQITKGQNCEEVIHCGAVFQHHNGGIVPFRVAECSVYHPLNVPWLHEMEQMAWIIEARRRGPAGFSEPERGEMEVIVSRPKDRGPSDVPSTNS